MPRPRKKLFRTTSDGEEMFDFTTSIPKDLYSATMKVLEDELAYKNIQAWVNKLLFEALPHHKKQH